MLSKTLAKALNDQMNEEMYSSRLYLSMAICVKLQGWDGLSNWFMVQGKEEWAHAMKFYDYLFARGAHPSLDAIKKPPCEWKSPLDVFSATLVHERLISTTIGNLVELAQSEKDHATEAFLQWFVNEQVEEEATAEGIVTKLTMIGEHTNGIFMLDHRLGARGR